MWKYPKSFIVISSASIDKLSDAFCTVLCKIWTLQPNPSISFLIMSEVLCAYYFFSFLFNPPKLVFVLSADSATIVSFN